MHSINRGLTIQSMKHNINAENLELLEDPDTPLDIIMALEEYNTTTNDYREASVKFISIMSLALSFIINSKDTKSASYGVAFAMGLESITGGKSMREIARHINVSSGTISWYAKQFKAYSGLKL